MSDPDEDDPAVLPTHIDSKTIKNLRTILDETRLRLLQQILAYDDGALSAEELAYRNTDLEDKDIDGHLRNLAKKDIVTRLKAEDPRNDLPDTYWAVTPKGISLLKRLGFFEEIKELSKVDGALQRTDRIREIEQFDGRPLPNWY